jgi:Flp pilus assembly protein TadG
MTGCGASRRPPQHRAAEIRCWPHRGDDRGSATLNLVVAFPALLLLLLLTVQAALVIHARHVAQAAAQEGLRDARLYGGTQADGQRTAEVFLAQTAGDLLTRRSVTTIRTATGARVVVRGTAISLVPTIQIDVVGRAAGPLERWVPDR